MQHQAETHSNAATAFIYRPTTCTFIQLSLFSSIATNRMWAHLLFLREGGGGELLQINKDAKIRKQMSKEEERMATNQN